MSTPNQHDDYQVDAPSGRQDLPNANPPEPTDTAVAPRPHNKGDAGRHFEAELWEYHPRVVQGLTRQFDRTTAEDAAGEMLKQMIRRGRRQSDLNGWWNGIENKYAYLLQVARNAALKLIKQSQRYEPLDSCNTADWDSVAEGDRVPQFEIDEAITAFLKRLTAEELEVVLSYQLFASDETPCAEQSARNRKINADGGDAPRNRKINADDGAVRNRKINADGGDAPRNRKINADGDPIGSGILARVADHLNLTHNRVRYLRESALKKFKLWVCSLNEGSPD